jgi:PAS fold
MYRGAHCQTSREPAVVRLIRRDAIDLLVMDEDRVSIVTVVGASLPDGGGKDSQTTVKHRDGSIRHVRSSTTAIRDKDGK